MSKQRAIVLSLATFTFAALVIIGSALTGAANHIDNVHWIGNPLPPCFVDAKLCGGHVLGSDEIGRDMLIRLIVGARTTLIVSLCALVCAVLIATALAQLTRRVRFTKWVVSRIADAIASISPWPYVAVISSISIGKRGPLLDGLWLALWAGLLCWPALWRVMVEGWPADPLLKKFGRCWCMLILLFVTVDFFGYGVRPPLASLGNMLSNVQENMQIAWWAAVLPALCAFLLVLTIEVAVRIGGTSLDETS